MPEIIFSALSLAAIFANIRRRYYGSAVVLTACLVSALYLFSVAPDNHQIPEPVRIAKGVAV